MGLLDDLKREADLAREAKETEAERLAKLEVLYRSSLQPKLLEIYRYLSEMIEQLEAVGWTVMAAYDIPGIGSIEGFRQGGYRLHIDSAECPKRVSIGVACTLDDERRYTVSGAQADELSRFLVAQKLQFTEWPLRNSLGEPMGSVYQVKLGVRGGLVFEADVASSRIRVITHNFEGLADREYLFGPASLDGNWLDDLGHFLLRKKTVLGGQSLSEEALQRLRQLAREEEQRVAEISRGGDEKRGLLGNWRDRLFKPGK